MDRPHTTVREVGIDLTRIGLTTANSNRRPLPPVHESELAAVPAEEDPLPDLGHWTEPRLTTRRVPSRVRLLCAGRTEPSWVSLTLQLDAIGCHEPFFRWLDDGSQILSLLRDETFDCLIIESNLRWSEQAAESDALPLIRAIRASGCQDPIVIVAPAASDPISIGAAETFAELLVTHAGWHSPALARQIELAMEHTQLRRENHRLAVADRRRSLRERDEAAYLLDQQRRMIVELEDLTRKSNGTGELSDPDEPVDHSDPVTPTRVTSANDSAAGGRSKPTAERTDGSPAIPSPWQWTWNCPIELDRYYQELLRTFVIMGSGNLATEIARMAEVLAAAQLSPRQVMELHLHRVETLVHGLGTRSTRHVMARADLLALEVMISLAECYQQQTSAPV